MSSDSPCKAKLFCDAVLWNNVQNHRNGLLLASAFTLSISASNATSRSIRLGKQGEH